MERHSFERFYLEKIALGEGCGCAEHVTRIRDLDALGERVRSGQWSQPASLPASGRHAPAVDGFRPAYALCRARSLNRLVIGLHCRHRLLAANPAPAAARQHLYAAT